MFVRHLHVYNNENVKKKINCNCGSSAEHQSRASIDRNTEYATHAATHPQLTKDAWRRILAQMRESPHIPGRPHRLRLGLPIWWSVWNTYTCLRTSRGPWAVVSATRRSSGVAPRACVRVYARVLVPPNLYRHTYIHLASASGAWASFTLGYSSAASGVWVRFPLATTPLSRMPDWACFALGAATTTSAIQRRCAVARCSLCVRVSCSAVVRVRVTC